MNSIVKKQYKRLYPNGKEVSYIKFDDNVLTTDGILMSNDDILNLSYVDYMNKLVDTEEYDKYNFEESLYNNKLIKNKIFNQEIELKNDFISNESETSKNSISNVKKQVTNKIKKSKKIKIDFVSVVLKAIVISCSILSIYFSGTYLTKLQNIFIGYLISFAMLMYGLISSQITRDSFRNKKYIRGILFLFTSIITLGFSMFTSLDVNMCKYYDMNQDNIKIEVKEKKNSMHFELLKEELEDNKAQIDKLNEDISIQQKQYVLSWDSNLGKNVIIDGKISSSAQDKINKDNELIINLQNRNKEINKELIELVNDGLVDENISKTDKSKSLTELLGAISNLSSNTIQMLILIFPAFMIDGINVLSLTILNIKKEKKK